MGDRSKAHIRGEERVRAWCLAVVRVLHEMAPGGTAGQLGAALEGFEFAVARADHTGLKQVARDLHEAIGGLSPEQRATLNAELRARVGIGSDAYRPDLQKEVARILARGVISDDDEFRMAEARADEVSANDGQVTELQSINVLLADYVNKVHRR
jgi:hypothetical protein